MNVQDWRIGLYWPSALFFFVGERASNSCSDSLEDSVPLAKELGVVAVGEVVRRRIGRRLWWEWIA